jgi:hypothetical protein
VDGNVTRGMIAASFVGFSGVLPNLWFPFRANCGNDKE